MGRKVVIAGGGTGGHLYPGIALAKALRKEDIPKAAEKIGEEFARYETEGYTKAGVEDIVGDVEVHYGGGVG